jgi:hypothetical protein
MHCFALYFNPDIGIPLSSFPQKAIADGSHRFLVMLMSSVHCCPLSGLIGMALSANMSCEL